MSEMLQEISIALTILIRACIGTVCAGLNQPTVSQANTGFQCL